MAVFSDTFSVPTTRTLEWIAITPQVAAIVQESGLEAGIACVTTRHTTAAVLLNEFQESLMADLQALGERLVPSQEMYRHNDSRYSDCERGNAQAHLRAALLGSGITLSIAQGGMVLGRHQSIIFVEFDGPRTRQISVHLIGE